MHSCPYCDEPITNPRRKQCGKPDCKRAAKAAYMREWQRNYKAEHGKWYARAEHGDAQRAYSRRARSEKGHWRTRYPEAGAAYDARRRALTVQATIGETFAPRDVHDRDHWTCRLCGRPVEQSLAWPHPMSASVDHIVPLSRGGDHSLANVQCAHLSCNCRKGNSLYGLGASAPRAAPAG